MAVPVGMLRPPNQHFAAAMRLHLRHKLAGLDESKERFCRQSFFLSRIHLRKKHISYIYIYNVYTYYTYYGFNSFMDFIRTTLSI